MNCTSHLKFENGLPPSEFIVKAWASEPLTTALKDVNLPFSLPNPDEDISVIAKDQEDVVVGQCSTNRVIKYWDHIEKIDASNQNIATQTFIAIHQKAEMLKRSI